MKELLQGLSIGPETCLRVYTGLPNCVNRCLSVYIYMCLSEDKVKYPEVNIDGQLWT